MTERLYHGREVFVELAVERPQFCRAKLSRGRAMTLKEFSELLEQQSLFQRINRAISSGEMNRGGSTGSKKVSPVSRVRGLLARLRYTALTFPCST